MIKAWALLGMDGCVIGHPFETKEAAQATVDSMGVLGSMMFPEEIDYNDEPLSEAGKLRVEELGRILGEKGVRKLHMSKMPGFYKMNADERVEFMINMLTIKGEPVDFGDRSAPNSDVVPQSVRDMVSKLPPTGSA